MIILQLIFAMTLIASGLLLLKWVIMPGARWQFAGYKILVGTYNIILGVICLMSTIGRLFSR